MVKRHIWSTPPTSLERRALLSAPLALGLGCEGAQGAKAGAAKAMNAPETLGLKKMLETQRQPALFIGHGSPMNAIEDNPWSRAFQRLGSELPKPRAVLCVSAHWYVEGTFITGDEHPETIHDFGGFPRALHEISYPARGDVALARRVVQLLGADAARLSVDWGLDHGSWTVLRYLLPKADVPVLQLSIDARLPGERHVAIGRALAPLRDEGILILGSGNIVHNLPDAFGRMRAPRRGPGTGDVETPGWATAFDADAAQALAQHDTQFLASAWSTASGKVAHPTPDHYLPLLYVAGAASASDEVTFPITGFDLGSISMRAVRFDAKGG